MMREPELESYMESVFDELEKLDYPDLVIEFDERDVSNSISPSIILNYVIGISPRMTAIIIWSLTMNCQIIRATKHMTKH